MDEAETDVYTSADLGVKLDDLWFAERCCWHIDFDGGAGTEAPWTLILEWTQESGNPHHADWTTHYWNFYGVTVEEALTEAIAWCEALLPFAVCESCDGKGHYWTKECVGGPAIETNCEDCQGTGLAHPQEDAKRGDGA